MSDDPESLPVSIGIRRSECIRQLRHGLLPDNGTVTAMEELARRMAQLAETQQRQLELLERQNENGDGPRPKATITPYKDGEDIEDFFSTFERAMQLHRIPERQWPQHLVGVWAGKARAAGDPMAEYGAIKDAVLTRFEVTPEASRIKLREMKYDPKADPNDLLVTLLVTLRMRARRWLLPVEAEQDYGEDEGRKQREDMIVDRVVKEQFLNMVPRQAREWLVQQKVETSGELAQRLREYKLFQR